MVLGEVMPAVPGAKDAFVVTAVDPPGDLVLTVPDGHGGNAVAWEHHLEPLANGRTRLIVRGRTSSHWLDLARAKPPAGHRRIFIERAYAALARLPRPMLIAFAALGHRVMEARHLRGIQRRSTAASAPGAVSGEAWRKALLVCGMASSLLYAAMIWTIRYEGYNPISQVPSELTAIGAPTQALWARLGWIYTMLVTAFAFGLWKSAGRNRAVRIAGGLILAYASLGLLWPFAAMHQREVLAAGGGTLSDTMHVLLGGVTVFLNFLAIGVGATAFGKRFGVYSIATIVVLFVFGGLTFLEAPRLQANLPTPWIGLWERINISVFLLWIAVLATALFRTPNWGVDTRQGQDHDLRQDRAKHRNVRYRLRRPDVRPVSIVARRQPSIRVRRPRIRATSVRHQERRLHAHPHGPGHLREHAGFRGRTSSSDSSGAGNVGMDRHAALRCRVGVGSGDRGRGRLRGRRRSRHVERQR
jgi:hypothetical protein